MYAQSQPAPGKTLSAYDIYIQENIARREALRVKLHPYTPKNEPIRTVAENVSIPKDTTAMADMPVLPEIKKKRVRKKPAINSGAKPENRTKTVKPRPDRNKGKIIISDNKPLQRQPRAGPL